jgi:isopentenyl diphosphate isomerase/L-lactate dehydrogenase-like FMN-dependent dehydrogenase
MAKPYNIDGYRNLARRRLPRAVFDFVDGGSEDETAVAANRAAFAAWSLVPRIHEGVAPIQTATTLCGQHLSIPLLFAPTGGVGVFHPRADLAAARLAAERGLIMVMSTASSYTIEEIAAEAETKPWFQLYPVTDRDFYGSLLERAASAGFRGLVVTVDTSVPSRRERDVANAFSVPPRLTVRNAGGIVRHPVWSMRMLRHRRVSLKGFSDRQGAEPIHTFVRRAKEASVQFGRGLIRATWDELAWIRERWEGPMGLKGVVSPGDALRAVELGIEVIVVSNHGGRQLDSAIGTAAALPGIVDAVAGRAEVVLDGGIRRGTDIVKALCLGARAVMIGRPWVYGVAAAGDAGVAGIVQCLENELRIDLDLLGEPDVRRLDRSFLRPAAGMEMPAAAGP